LAVAVAVLLVPEVYTPTRLAVAVTLLAIGLAGLVLPALTPSILVRLELAAGWYAFRFCISMVLWYFLVGMSTSQPHASSTYLMLGAYAADSTSFGQLSPIRHVPACHSQVHFSFRARQPAPLASGCAPH
jgi:membrane protein required for beta-lactamase induction